MPPCVACCRGPALQGQWTRWPLDVPSNRYNSAILCFCDPIGGHGMRLHHSEEEDTTNSHPALFWDSFCPAAYLTWAVDSNKVSSKDTGLWNYLLIIHSEVLAMTIITHWNRASCKVFLNPLCEAFYPSILYTVFEYCHSGSIQFWIFFNFIFALYLFALVPCKEKFPGK